MNYAKIMENGTVRNQLHQKRGLQTTQGRETRGI